MATNTQVDRTYDVYDLQRTKEDVKAAIDSAIERMHGTVDWNQLADDVKTAIDDKIDEVELNEKLEEVDSKRVHYYYGVPTVNGAVLELTLDEFDLKPGTTVSLNCGAMTGTTDGVSRTMQFKVNGTSKTITRTKSSVSSFTTNELKKSGTIDLIYDGEYWIIEGGALGTSEVSGVVKLSDRTDSNLKDTNNTAATPYAVKRAYDLASQALNNRFAYIVSSEASNTPEGVEWVKSGTTITGTLQASDDTMHNIYLVPSGNNNYSQYVTIKNGSTYSWQDLGNTGVDLSDFKALAYKETVGTGDINDYAVTTDKIANLNVTTGKIANLNVTTGKIADGAITEDKIDDDAVTEDKIDDGAVTEDKIDDGAVTEDKLSDEFKLPLNKLVKKISASQSSPIDFNNIEDGFYTFHSAGNQYFEHLPPFTGGTTLIQITTNLHSTTSGYTISQYAVQDTGKVWYTRNGSYNTTTNVYEWGSWAKMESDIADGSVTTDKITNGAVTTGKIADGTVTYAKLHSNLKTTIDSKVAESDVEEMLDAWSQEHDQSNYFAVCDTPTVNPQKVVTIPDLEGSSSSWANGLTVSVRFTNNVGGNASDMRQYLNVNGYVVEIIPDGMNAYSTSVYGVVPLMPSGGVGMFKFNNYSKDSYDYMYWSLVGIRADHPVSNAVISADSPGTTYEGEVLPVGTTYIQIDPMSLGTPEVIAIYTCTSDVIMGGTEGNAWEQIYPARDYDTTGGTIDAMFDSIDGRISTYQTRITSIEEDMIFAMTRGVCTDANDSEHPNKIITVDNIITPLQNGQRLTVTFTHGLNAVPGTGSVMFSVDNGTTYYDFIPNGVDTCCEYAFFEGAIFAEPGIPIEVEFDENLECWKLVGSAYVNNSMRADYSQDYDTTGGTIKDKFDEIDNAIDYTKYYDGQVLIPTAQDQFEWSVDTTNDEAGILRYKGSATEVVVPPFYYNNGTAYPVVVIDNVNDDGVITGAFDSTDVVTVVLPNTITDLAINAFYNCQDLESVNIPSSMESIGTSAFENCSSLHKIVIDKEEVSVGANVFLSCTNLTVYCYQGSQAETVAAIDNIPVEYLDDVITYDTTSVTINPIKNGKEYRCLNTGLTSLTVNLPTMDTTGTTNIKTEFDSLVTFYCGSSSFQFSGAYPSTGTTPQFIQYFGKDCDDGVFLPSEQGYVYNLAYWWNGKMYVCTVV